LVNTSLLESEAGRHSLNSVACGRLTGNNGALLAAARVADLGNGLLYAMRAGECEHRRRRFLDRFDTQSGNLFNYVRYDCVPNIYGHRVVTPKSRHSLAQICCVCSSIVWLSESTVLRLASKVVMQHPILPTKEISQVQSS
jgi:hypothetical protein